MCKPVEIKFFVRIVKKYGYVCFQEKENIFWKIKKYYLCFLGKLPVGKCTISLRRSPFHFIQLHLRRVGVEAKPDVVAQKDVPGGSSSNDQNDGRHGNDAPEDDRSGPEDANGSPPASEDPNSGNLENQNFSNTEISNVSIECFKLALASEVLSRLSCECIVLNLFNLHLGTLYFNQKCYKEV